MTSAPREMEGYNKMIMSLGFIPEGLLREAQVFNGKPVDMVLYGILKHEFYSEEVQHDSKKNANHGRRSKQKRQV